MSLKDKAISGTIWRGSSRLFSQIIQFIVLIILVRLLTKNDFGLIFIISIYTGFLTMFKTLGFDIALIQKDNITEEHFNVVFWISLLMGFILFGIVIAISPLIAWFYDEPILISLTCAMAIALPLSASTLVQQSILKKNLNFRAIAIIGFVSVLISGTLGITAAFLGAGVWALVIRTISGVVIETFAFWIYVRWRPMFSFSKEKFIEMWGFSSRIAVYYGINFCRRNIDFFLIGKFLGTTALGYYGIAYKLMIYPIINIAHTLLAVGLPVFSRIKNEPEKLRKAYIKVVQYISFIIYPLMLGLLVLAPEFVIVVLGKQWMPAVFVIQAMCIVGLIQSTTTTVGTICLALGRSALMMYLEIFTFFTVGIAVVIGLKWNIEGVATAYAIVYGMLWFIYHLVASRPISLSLSKLAHVLMPGFLISAVMAGLIYGFKLGLHALNVSDLVVLICSVVFGTGVYLLTAHIFQLSSFKDLQGIVRGYIKRKPRNEK